MKWKDWTRSAGGRSNLSPLFKGLTERIRSIVANTHVGDNPENVASLILAQLAHKYHLSPADDTLERVMKR